MLIAIAFSCFVMSMFSIESILLLTNSDPIEDTFSYWFVKNVINEEDIDEP